MGKSKLTPDEAREYSGSLGKAATGNWELMDFAIHTLGVPAALGMEPEEWVQQIGGYVRLNVQQRREAVAKLSGKQSESGRYERSAAEVAAVLGLSEDTVKRDRDVLEAQKAAQAPEPAEIPAETDAQAPLSPEQKKAEIRRRLDLGQTNAQIAADLDIGVSTVSKERTAWNAEQADPHPLADQAARDLEEAGSSSEEVQAALDEQATEERLREQREIHPMIHRLHRASIDAAQRVRAYGVHSDEDEIEELLQMLKTARDAVNELVAAWTEARNELRANREEVN